MTGVGGEFIINYAAIGICATGPGRARHGAAPAGLPGPIRLCEDLRIRHGQASDGSGLRKHVPRQRPEPKLLALVSAPFDRYRVTREDRA